MDVVLREMELRDLDEVMEIEEKTFTTPWSRKSFEMEIKDNLLSKYIVAEIDEKVVGYGGMWLIVDEAHITNVAVDEAYKGQSIGNYLMIGMIKYCMDHDIARMTLEVRVSNTPAINLYKKHGFKEAGIRKNYYADDKEDALVMWKTI